MIGAVWDERGGQFAGASLQRLFRLSRVEPAILREYAFSAIGYTNGPLIRGHRFRSSETAVMGGDLAPTAEEEVLRESCCRISVTPDSLVLTRGPFGGRPLYYASENGGRTILAATRLGPLVAAISPTPVLSEDHLGALLWQVAQGDPSETPYRGISRVLSCESLTFRSGHVGRRRSVPQRPATRTDAPEELASELTSRIQDAVGRACRSSSRVAVMTGGGLDSSGLLAMVLARSKTVSGFSCDAFAIDYGEPNSDRPHLRSLAAWLGLNPHRVRSTEAGELLPRCFIVDGAPFEWPVSPAELLVFTRARQSGADAVLSGAGGDHLFDGDFQSFSERTRRGDWRALVDAARLRTFWPSSRADRLWRLVVRPLLVRAVSSHVSTRKRRIRQAKRAPEWAWAGTRLRMRVAECAGGAEPDPRADWFSELARSDGLRASCDIRGQMEVFAGIPGLDPYLDATLIEFVASIPPALMFHDHVVRGLYRLALKGWLPESLRLRVDKASLEPASRELFDSVRGTAAFQRLIRMERLADLGLVEPRPFQEALARWVDGRDPDAAWGSLWAALGIEAFVEAHDLGQLDAGAVEFGKLAVA